MTATDAAPVHLYTSAEVLAAVPGLTYRQLDYWTRTGIIAAIDDLPGSGVARGYRWSELRVIALVAALVDRLGANPRRAAELARLALECTATIAARGRHGRPIHLTLGDPQ